MSADVATVEALNTELYDAIEAGDLDRLGVVWAAGPHAEAVTCVHPGWPVLRGRTAVLRSWAVIMANTAYLQFFITDVAVDVIGDAAVLTCAENILTGVGGPSDASADSLPGGRVVTTNLFRRTPEGWRLYLHHASPVLEPSDIEPGDIEDET